MEIKRKYIRPEVTFIETELFEDVTDKCWADPSLYLLVDPTDECDGIVSPYKSDADYADLKDFKAKANGCNANMINGVKDYLAANYGSSDKTGRPHFLSTDDINKIMASGGGGQGQSLQTSQYIRKVRSY